MLLMCNNSSLSFWDIKLHGTSKMFILQSNELSGILKVYCVIL